MNGDLWITKANASGDGPQIQLWNPTAIVISGDQRAAIWLDNDAKLKFRSVAGAGFVFRETSNTYDMITITPDSRLGIGTETPQASLQVDDGTSKTTLGDAGGGSVLNWGISYLGFNTARNSGTWTTSNDCNNHNGAGVIYGGINIVPIGTTNGSSSNQTLSDANVANNIALKIAPNGTTYAKQIIVEATAFPDYVFKSTYQLKPLSEVKSYIDLNHHLPDMPTEKEVADHGLDVGEMSKLLTKKVEELTLYLIRQQKEIDELKC